MLTKLGTLILNFILNKVWGLAIEGVKYAIEKAKRNKSLEENKKKLDEAIKSKDDEAIKNASENSLNNN